MPLLLHLSWHIAHTEHKLYSKLIARKPYKFAGAVSTALCTGSETSELAEPSGCQGKATPATLSGLLLLLAPVSSSSSACICHAIRSSSFASVILPGPLLPLLAYVRSFRSSFLSSLHPAAQ